MKNLLLEGYDLQADYLQQALRPLLNPNHRVAVIPFSFRDDRIRSAEDWNQLYGKAGQHYCYHRRNRQRKIDDNKPYTAFL